MQQSADKPKARLTGDGSPSPRQPGDYQRSREEIVTVLQSFCAANRLRLDAFSDGTLAVHDLSVGYDGRAWSFDGIGPEGEK